jgi:hypothetical protein
MTFVSILAYRSAMTPARDAELDSTSATAAISFCFQVGPPAVARMSGKRVRTPTTYPSPRCPHGVWTACATIGPMRQSLASRPPWAPRMHCARTRGDPLRPAFFRELIAVRHPLQQIPDLAAEHLAEPSQDSDIELQRFIVGHMGERARGDLRLLRKGLKGQITLRHADLECRFDHRVTSPIRIMQEMIAAIQDNVWIPQAS